MTALKKYRISVFGETYVVVSDESEEHLTDTARYVDDLMKHVALKVDIPDSKRIAVLVSLRLASQLKSLEEKLVLYGHKEKELSEHIDQELASLSF